MDKPSGIMEKPLIDPLSWLSPSPKPQAYSVGSITDGQLVCSCHPATGNMK